MSTPPRCNDSDWVKHAEKNEWILHLFPFFLLIEHKPERRGEPPVAAPFVCSLKGAQLTMSELKAWSTLEEAKVGCIEWAMDYTLKIYEELGSILQRGNT